MSDEESQAETVPAPNRACAEDNMTTVSPQETPDIRQPYDNFMLRALRRLDTWVERRFRRTAPTNSTRKVTDYTSRAFLALPAPMPVYDVLDQPLWLVIICRNFENGLVWCCFILLMLEFGFFFWPVIAIYLLLRLLWPALPQLSYIAARSLLMGQNFWEWGPSKFMLKPGWRRAATLWWCTYLYISTHSDFEANYMRAWAENTTDPEKTTLIFVGDEELSIPWLEGDELDRLRLEHLRMFYLLLKLRRGLLEVIIPRTLVRIEWVKIEEASRVLGERIQTMDLGRRTGTLVARFHHPSLVEEGSKKLVEEESILEQSLRQDPKNDGVSVGVEFVRRYNSRAIMGIVSTPPLFSVIFATTWMLWFLVRKRDDQYDTQAIVSTAFTGASYLVTTGALGIALVAYLDAKVDDASTS